jgi:hypothetical protein
MLLLKLAVGGHVVDASVEAIPSGRWMRRRSAIPCGRWTYYRQTVKQIPAVGRAVDLDPDSAF